MTGSIYEVSLQVSNCKHGDERIFEVVPDEYLYETGFHKSTTE
jgi:hypothetical protein